MSNKALIGVGTPVYPEPFKILKRANLSIAPIAKQIAPIIIKRSNRVPVLKDWYVKIAGTIPKVNESLKESNSLPISFTVLVFRAIYPSIRSVSRLIVIKKNPKERNSRLPIHAHIKATKPKLVPRRVM